MAYCAPKGIPHSRFLDWPPDDQDKALAYQRFVAETCGSCGTRPEEWEADKFAFVGDQVHCSGCAALDQERENVPEGAKGVHVRLVTRAYGEARVARGEGVT